MSQLPNYLRMHRNRHGLSQADVAFLLGCRHGSKVSRYERFVRRPSLQKAFACELICGIPARELFAGIYEPIRQKTLKRAKLLLQRLEKAGSEKDEDKIARLKEILRSTKSANPKRNLS